MTTLAQTATDKPQQTLADPKRRQAIVGIIRQAKAHDAKAAELLESALKQ